MAETSKKNTNNSTSNSNNSNKTRKSRNEIIRTALGTYLKGKNYSATDKYRKSDWILIQNPKQMQYEMLMDDDLCKSNAFRFSNVFCLSNSSQLAEQQFSKFLQFIQSQNQSVKSDLQKLLRPLLCHLYIELLKGKDSQPATEFLRKFAHIIAPVDNLETPIANKINGSAVVVHDESANASPSSTTQITFVREPEVDQATQGYFKNLVQIMSTCLRIEELDSVEATRIFFSAKYEMELSLASLYALKKFLVQDGHVIILHVLQTWFAFNVQDSTQTDADLETDDSKKDATIKLEIKKENENDQIFTKLKEETTSENDKTKQSEEEKPFEFKKPLAVSIKRRKIKIKKKIKRKLKPAAKKKRPNVKLRNLRKSVLKMKTFDEPIQTIKVINASSNLTSGDIDPSECHLACGFADSTIRIWSLNRTKISGRKPFATYSTRSCDWTLVDKYNDVSSDDDDDAVDTNVEFKKTRNYARLKFIQKEKERFASQRCAENIFSDTEGLCLRGHSKGVTEVLFSKHHPLLFSVSKDLTMRAWKSYDYTCGAVYRGHSYPVWCVAESPLGLYLATGSRDYTARLWATDQEHPLQTYVAHTQDVDCVAFHPNGNYIATGSTDSTVRLWCVTSGKLFRVFTDCHLPVQCVSFSPDGKLLAAAGEETKIRIFDLAAGSQMMELKDHSAPITNLTWNPNNAKIASCCADGTIRVFNVQKNSSQSSSPLCSSSSMSSSSSKLLAMYHSDCRKSIKIMFNSNRTVSSIGCI